MNICNVSSDFEQKNIIIYSEYSKSKVIVNNLFFEAKLYSIAKNSAANMRKFYGKSKELNRQLHNKR
jgi:hypothetical protein